MIFTDEHQALRKTVLKFVEQEINPYADQWEEEGGFPAHELFKKLGDQGLLGITRDPEYGGMGLDLSYGGCRQGVIDDAVHNYGLSMEDIICKLSDEDVIRAVHSACQDYNIFNLLEDHQ